MYFDTVNFPSIFFVVSTHLVLRVDHLIFKEIWTGAKLGKKYYETIMFLK